MENSKLILDIVEKYKNEQITLGLNHAKAGCNGKYKMQETPVRTTAHWLISFACFYEMTSDRGYLVMIKRYAEYLKDVVYKSENGVVVCIDDVKGFNRPNGLMGQAWIIEALVKAGKVLGDSQCYRAAYKVFIAQRYDWERHLWNIIDINNEPLGIDVAFNHNLWFALAGLLLASTTENTDVKNIVDDFMDNILGHILIYNSGLISHFVVNSDNKFRDARFKIKKMICQLNKKGIPFKNPNQCEYERAYHLFSVYAFAQIKLINPKYYFFSTKQWEKIKDYALNINNFTWFPNCNDYAYRYNSPAFEYPLIQLILTGNVDEESLNRLMQIQINDTYDGERLSKNVLDVETLNARIYEYMQYLELCIKEYK